MSFLLPVLATASTDATTASSGVMLLTSVLPFALLIVVFYFILIRPQRKRDKQTQKMRNNLQVGDEIVTVGGVVGLVISLKEDTLVIETGGDRSKIRIKRWAVQENLTIHDDADAEVKS